MIEKPPRPVPEIRSPDNPSVAPFAAISSSDIADLLSLMAALRTPQTGCAWDLAQSFETIAPYTVEEAYEVADAIARGDLSDLRDELGDLLLQVVFHARLAEEQGSFAFGDVVQAITAKLIRRHPHVFDKARDLAPEAVKAQWETIKAAEREARDRGADAALPSVLDGIARALPALTVADKLTRRAAAVGFTWSESEAVLHKVDEELAEVRAALREGDVSHAAEEIGDLLFTVANLARHIDVDPEAALRAANAKFERRFRSVERALAELGRLPVESDLTEMDALWNLAKRAETTDPDQR